MEKEIKTAQATTNLEVYVSCPYCDFYQNRLDELREHFDHNSISSEECEAELTCHRCKKDFIVDNITY